MEHKMDTKESEENTSVMSRINMFNQQVEDHQKWQSVNPFSHCSVRDMPRHSIQKDLYGTPPSGSLSEKRALKAQILSLQEILQLCELIYDNGQHEKKDDDTDTLTVSLTFGNLFEMYNQISDKLLGTLLCARKHKYIDFKGETLFQGRDDAEAVRLACPFSELKDSISNKIKNLRRILTDETTE